MHNYTDWKDTPYGRNHTARYYPDSCCDGDNCTLPHNGTNVFEKVLFCKRFAQNRKFLIQFLVQGCYTKLLDIVHGFVLVIAGVATVVLLFLVRGLCNKNCGTCVFIFCRFSFSLRAWSALACCCGSADSRTLTRICKNRRPFTECRSVSNAGCALLERHCFARDFTL